MKTLEPPLKFLLGTDLTTVIACSGAKCDGTVMALSACRSEKGWVMLVEVKNEVGTGGCDLLSKPARPIRSIGLMCVTSPIWSNNC